MSDRERAADGSGHAPDSEDGAAPDPVPVPVDALHDLTRVTDVALSPSGDRVAFTATEYDVEADEQVASLFVAPTDGAREPHRLTRVPGASDPRWSPEGDRLAFLAPRERDVERRVGAPEEDGDGDESGDAEATEDGEESGAGGEDAGGDEEPRAQVWLFDLALGGDARQVTDFDEGADEFDWAPDGERLVVAARDPTDEEREYLGARREGGPLETERLQHKLDGVGYTDTVTRYLFVVDVATGEAERLDDAYGGGAFEDLRGMQPAWGADGRVAFLSCRAERPDATFVTDAYTVSPDGSDLRRLTGGDRVVDSPTWDEAGERLAFVSADPENWCIPSEVRVHDDGEVRSLTADLDRTVARTATLSWDGDDVYTLLADEGRTRLVRAHADGAPPDRCFEAQGDARALQCFDHRGAERAALVLSDPREGRSVYAVDATDLDAETEPESLTRLAALDAAVVDAHSMPTVERVAWDSDGQEVEGVLYHDPAVDPADGPHPLVVAIHGGPVSYDEPEFRFEHALFTSRGYLVLRPNYRGGSSYGREFAEALRGRWGTVEVDDVAAGVRWAVAEGYADPGRVFGHGFSYGGIAQGFLVTQEPDLLTAAAPEHGIYDLRSAYGTDDSHLWATNEYGVPWENLDAYDASSAITDVGRLETPLLVMAGDSDWRCPPSQSEQLYVSARRQGVDAKLVVYPDEHHDVGDPSRTVHRFEEILDWYERHDPAVEHEDASGEDEDGG